MARDWLTPVLGGATRDLSNGLVFRKQILPVKKIAYRGQPLDFTPDYLKDLVRAFNQGAYDQVPFVLADDNNRHTADPERVRGEITQISLATQGEDPGLYATIAFPTPEAAKAVMDNPKLGVSCRIREGVTKSDGRAFSKALVHVCGTVDPVVTGMSPWRKVDLADDGEQAFQIDLSTSDYSEDAVGSKGNNSTTGDGGGSARVDFSQWSDEQLQHLASELGVTDEDIQNYIAGSDDDADGADDDGADESADAQPVLVGAGAGADLSNVQALAQTANQQAGEALRQLAQTAWDARRTNLVGQGVPPAMVDLAEPLFNRPAGNMVIDLSNEGGAAEVDVTSIVAKLLDGMKGYVDLAVEAGHGGQFQQNDTKPTDDPILQQWEREFPG